MTVTVPRPGPMVVENGPYNGKPKGIKLEGGGEQQKV